MANDLGWDIFESGEIYILDDTKARNCVKPIFGLKRRQRSKIDFQGKTEARGNCWQANN
jgi:CRISPR/Cas system CMR subunit Cmr4 (Cas7 group RAMP superfamily)